MTQAADFIAWQKKQTPDAYTSPHDVIDAYGSRAQEVTKYAGTSSRWTQEAFVVFAFPDGSLVEANYDAGLTEEQETDYEYTDWWEVEAYEHTVTRYRVVNK